MDAVDQTPFWNAAATARQFTHPLDIARIAARLAPDAHILDFGCGQGRLSGELARAGFTRLTGVDSSAGMIDAARVATPRALFLMSDGLPLPFADGSFDAILLFAVLTCVPSAEAQEALANEFKRVLRPGGLMVVSDYPLQDDPRNLERYEQFAAELGYGTFRLPDGAVLRHHRREWFDRLFRGFIIEDAVGVDAVTMNGNPARIVQLWMTRPLSGDAR